MTNQSALHDTLDRIEAHTLEQLDLGINVQREDLNEKMFVTRALRLALEALSFYSKGRARSQSEICYYTLDGGAGARNALASINSLFPSPGDAGK